MSSALLRDDDGNAFNALAGAARRASVPVLILLETVGLVSALGIYAWAPRLWPLMLPCIAITSCGLWGLCDHMVESLSGRKYRRHRQALRWSRRTIAAVGITAAIGGLYLMIGWIMGVFIS
jgi:hypothetical protein